MKLKVLTGKVNILLLGEIESDNTIRIKYPAQDLRLTFI